MRKRYWWLERIRLPSAYLSQGSVIQSGTARELSMSLQMSAWSMGCTIGVYVSANRVRLPGVLFLHGRTVGRLRYSPSV